MSFEHLPFSAFALESAAAQSPGALGGYTLTLDPAPPAHSLLTMSMGGSLSLDLDEAQPGALRACVVPASARPFNLTF